MLYKTFPNQPVGLRSLAGVILIAVLFLCFPLLAQETQDSNEVIDIQVDSQDELAVRQQAEALNNEGYERLAAEQYAEAETLFRRALSLDSTSQLYYENLARSLGGQQKIEQVVEVYARAQQQFPDVSDLYYYQGDALQKLKKYEEARSAYTKAIALLDKNSNTQLQHLYYFNRGNTYLKQRAYADAQQDYDRAIEINEFHYGSFVTTSKISLARAPIGVKLRKPDTRQPNSTLPNTVHEKSALLDRRGRSGSSWRSRNGSPPCRRYAIRTTTYGHI